MKLFIIPNKTPAKNNIMESPLILTKIQETAFEIEINNKSYKKLLHTATKTNKFRNFNEKSGSFEKIKTICSLLNIRLSRCTIQYRNIYDGYKFIVDNEKSYNELLSDLNKYIFPMNNQLNKMNKLEYKQALHKQSPNKEKINNLEIMKTYKLVYDNITAINNYITDTEYDLDDLTSDLYDDESEIISYINNELKVSPNQDILKTVLLMLLETGQLKCNQKKDRMLEISNPDNVSYKPNLFNKLEAINESDSDMDCNSDDDVQPIKYGFTQ